MATELLVTDDFKGWYEPLSLEEQTSIDPIVELLAEKGVALDYPYSSKINDSRHSGMREPRIQHAGKPYRILYIFDPLRNAVLLLGGSKVGLGNRWYERAIPRADDLYDQYLRKIP